jgi:hypothetical protein
VRNTFSLVNDAGYVDFIYHIDYPYWGVPRFPVATAAANGLRVVHGLAHGVALFPLALLIHRLADRVELLQSPLPSENQIILSGKNSSSPIK